MEPSPQQGPTQGQEADTVIGRSERRRVAALHQTAQRRQGMLGGGVGGIRPNPPLNRPLGYDQPATGYGTASSGYPATVREGIVQIYFGCQSVMLYAGEGVVELYSSLDPSGMWNMLTPEAAEELGHQLVKFGQMARAKATNPATQYDPTTDPIHSNQ